MTSEEEQQQQPQSPQKTEENSQKVEQQPQEVTQESTPTPEQLQPQDIPQQPEQPEVTPAIAAAGGREVSHKILYVGGLDKSITEENLQEIFSTHGTVDSVKVLFDKNKQNFNYAFVEFEEESAAKNAFDALNGQVLNNSEIKINWAYQSQQAKSNPEHFNIFVGDLSTEIDDDQLRKAFARFPSLVQAHVMWDMQSGRSRGYGFISFSDQVDAEQVLNTMNGEVIGNRAIRLNWASHKQNQHSHHSQGGFNNHRGNYNGHRHHHNHHHLNGLNHNGIPTNGYATSSLINGASPLSATGPAGSTGATTIGANGLPINGGGLNGSTGLNLLSPQSYDLVLRKSPSWQTTVYLGNLAHFTTQNDLIPLLQNFGFIVDLKFYPERNCAFVKYDSHERAALAIVQLSGFIVNGRPLKSGWGKDRPQNIQFQGYGHVMYQAGR